MRSVPMHVYLTSLLLSACTGQTPLERNSAETNAATNAIYIGVLRYTVVDDHCGKVGQEVAREIHVFNHRFDFRWNPRLHVDVAADGSFDASGFVNGGNKRGVVTRISGRIGDGRIEADVGNPYCAGHLSLKAVRPAEPNSAALLSSESNPKATMVDGLYRGMRRYTKTDETPHCGRVGEERSDEIDIAGNRFEFRWDPVLSVGVSSDGSFAERALMNGRTDPGDDSTMLIGSIKDGHLDLDVANPFCAAHLDLQKICTHNIEENSLLPLCRG